MPAPTSEVPSSAPNGVELHPVKSSHIAAIGYDPSEQALHVRFHSGAQFVYHNVPPHAHADLLSAQSIGSHFHSNVRGKFQATRL